METINKAIKSMQSAHVGHPTVGPRGVKRQSVRRFVRCQSSNGNGARNVARETTISRLIHELDTLAIPGCYDALSAKLLSKSGHHAGFVSGYAVSASLLGEPDIGLLSAPEMATATRHICEAVPNFPIIADADTGGGNTANVERTVKQLISAGAKGCVLEDQVWPKKLGHMKAHEVTSIDEFVAKIAAAREAIGDADFFLIARTDSRSLSAKNGLVDAIVRVNVYADAGADAVLVEAPRSTYELKQIASNTHGFRAINMLEGGGITPLHSVEDLKAMGFHLVMYPLAGVFSAAKALQNVYGMLQQTGSTSGALDSMLSFDEFGGVVDFNSKLESEQQQLRVLTQDKLHVRIRAPTHPAPLS